MPFCDQCEEILISSRGARREVMSATRAVRERESHLIHKRILNTQHERGDSDHHQQGHLRDTDAP